MQSKSISIMAIKWMLNPEGIKSENSGALFEALVPFKETL